MTTGLPPARIARRGWWLVAGGWWLCHLRLETANLQRRAKLALHRLKPSATRFSILSKLRNSWGQDSSPAADVHVGLFVLGYG